MTVKRRPVPGDSADSSDNADSSDSADRLADLVAATVTETGHAERGRLLGVLARLLVGSARVAGVRAVAGGRWLAEQLIEAAPRIPVRDAVLLRRHHPDKTDDEIADTLVRHAARATAAIGAAAGAMVTVEYAVPAALLAVPAQLAAETLAVAAVEIKLVAELHELYGEEARGTLTERGTAYLMSWMRQRVVEPAVASTGLAAVLGSAAQRELRTHLLRRVGRSSSSLAPLLAGAVAGAEVNRRTTRSLGEKLTAELRGRQAGR